MSEIRLFDMPRVLRATCLLIGLVLAKTAVCEMPYPQRGTDVVILANGDHISGQLSRIDNTIVELATDSLGFLRIPWKAIHDVKAANGRSWQSNDDTTQQAALRYLTFNIALFSFTEGNVTARIDDSHIQVPVGTALLPSKDHTPQETQQEHAAAPPAPPQVKAPITVPAKFQFGIDAPQTVVDGTQSQETFGGNVRLFYRAQPLCGSASWYTAMLLSASHNRNWKVQSKANVTDTYDGTVSLKNQVFKGSKTSVVVIGDLFGNSSLEMGLQQSYGAGLSRVFYASACGRTHSYILSFAGDATLRYVHQRLYSPGNNLDLAGLNLRESMSYIPLFKDSKGNQVERFGFDLSLWTMPTLNDIRGIQAGGALSISAPLTNSLSMAITEEDDYINNAPKAKRKNYLKSGLTLNYTFPAAPH